MLYAIANPRMITQNAIRFMAFSPLKNWNRGMMRFYNLLKLVMSDLVRVYIHPPIPLIDWRCETIGYSLVLEHVSV